MGIDPKKIKALTSDGDQVRKFGQWSPGPSSPVGGKPGGYPARPGTSSDVAAKQKVTEKIAQATKMVAQALELLHQASDLTSLSDKRAYKISRVSNDLRELQLQMRVL